MNLTLRICTSTRSFILKQSRPWVEKYESIPAPWERNRVEQSFYQSIVNIPEVSAFMPHLLDAHESSNTLILEDLGNAADMSGIYETGRVDRAHLHALAEYLGWLHRATKGSAPAGFENREMRRLNHEHIFLVPFLADNGIDLDFFERGLRHAANELRADSLYRSLSAQVALRYLEDGASLLHGDYFPGSWLLTGSGVRIIDPEFSFFGDGEFDLGVAIAHLYLANCDPTAAAAFVSNYVAIRGREPDEAWVARYAAVEIVRRLLGVAQLPIPPSTDSRCKQLRMARYAMLTQDWKVLWSHS